EINFDGQGLGDVIEFLQDVSGLPLRADWVELHKVGITRESPVRAHLRGVSMELGLRTVLADASGGSGTLEYYLLDGAITITTREAARKRFAETRLYDLRDLLVEVPDF